MKTLLQITLLIAGAAQVQAAIIQTISLNLSPLNPGSTLSGTFALSDSPSPGDTVSVLLSFSDPANYSPTSLPATITVLSGTPSGFAIDFSDLAFTNLNGTVGSINTRDVNLMRFASAMCDSFPCTATGLFQDRSPAVFTSTYSITPAPVPEPAYALPMGMLLTAIVFRRWALWPKQ